MVRDQGSAFITLYLDTTLTTELVVGITAGPRHDGPVRMQKDLLGGGARACSGVRDGESRLRPRNGKPDCK